MNQPARFFDLAKYPGSANVASIIKKGVFMLHRHCFGRQSKGAMLSGLSFVWAGVLRAPICARRVALSFLLLSMLAEVAGAQLGLVAWGDNGYGATDVPAD